MENKKIVRLTETQLKKAMANTFARAEAEKKAKADVKKK